MRCIKLLSFLLLVVVCNTVLAQAGNMNGTWIPVRQIFAGAELPVTAFEKQRLTMNDSTYIFVAESTDKGTVQYSGTNKMDIYGKEGVNAGKHFTAIYKFEKEELSICYNLEGTEYPEKFDTKGQPLYFLCVFKKE